MEKKRIFAWIGIILLVGMYVATFIFALGKSPFFKTMFLASVAATIIVPVLLYGILMMTGVLKPKKSAVIDSIIFDVGYVLADFPLKEYARKAGVSEENLNLLLKKLFGTTLWREFDLGNKTKEEVIDDMIAAMPELEEDIRRILPGAFTSICAYPYTESWLRSLKEKGYKLYILSNWPEFAYEMHKDGALAFEKLMDGAVWSYQIHAAKPDKTIFDALKSKYRLDPARSVFIDDTLENVQAARKYGYPSIQFRGLAETQKQLATLGVK